MLEVPIGLGDVVHARAAHEDGRCTDEDVETSKHADNPFDQFCVASDRAQIGCQGQVRAAVHLRYDFLHLVFDEIDNRYPRSRRAEGERNFASDFPCAAGD